MTELHVIVPEPVPAPTPPQDNPVELIQEVAETVTETVEDLGEDMSELAEQMAKISERLDALEKPPVVPDEPPEIPTPAPEPALLNETPKSPEGQVSDLDANSNASNVDSDLNAASRDNPPSVDNDALGSDSTEDTDKGSGTGSPKGRSKDKAPRIKMSNLKRALIGGSGGYKKG